MASLSEIVQLCRLCLVKDDVNIPIFDDLENARQISLKISSCLPVKVSIDDNLPKKICDGCSSKLDLCYEFWNSTAQAEKTLLSMVEQSENKVPETVVPQPILLKVEPSDEDQCEPPVPEPILVKTEEETDEPFAKRPRRSAAIKAQMQISPESDDDNGPGTIEDAAEVEDDIDDPDVDIDEVKPGPSGVNHKSGDSESNKQNNFGDDNCFDIKEENYDIKIETDNFSIDDDQHNELAEIHTDTCRNKNRFSSGSGKNSFDYSCCFILKPNFQGHRKKGRFKCKECGKSFLKKYMLTVHSRTHTGEKPYKCEQCGKCFTQKFNLRRHLMAHNNEKPYKCKECGKGFLDKYYVNVFHQRYHSGEKPFKCTQCLKSFVKKTELNRHSRIHISEKPYKCTECNIFFSNKTNLHTHIRRRHQGVNKNIKNKRKKNK